jgi:hypothetical protein
LEAAQVETPLWRAWHGPGTSRRSPRAALAARESSGAGPITLAAARSRPCFWPIERLPANCRISAPASASHHCKQAPGRSRAPESQKASVVAFSVMVIGSCFRCFTGFRSEKKGNV